ncbi:MAG: YbbR-like domain-containing protein [Emergencia sp.]
MFENRKFNIILSVIIAVCLWAYVIGETNPTDTQTFRDIPITLIGEQALDESGLAVLSVSAETVSVTLTGTRANIKQVSAKDISATVNLADAAMGENQLKIILRVPDNVEIEDKSINKVTVVIEEKVSREVDIQVAYEGSFEDEEEPITVDMSRTSAVVTGAASLVEKVDHIQAVVGEGKVTDKLKTFTAKLTPVDQNGSTIDNVSLSAKDVEISAQLATTRTVPLHVPVKDSHSDVVEKTYSVPKTITIKGNSDDLAGIDSVTCEEVDLSGLTEDARITLVPVLPAKVQVSAKSADNLVMTVTVKPVESRTFTFDGDQVVLKDLDDNLTAQVRTDRIQITVRGTAQALDALDNSDFTLTAGLQGLDEGAHSVQLTVKCSGDYISMDVNPEKIKVLIESE